MDLNKIEEEIRIYWKNINLKNYIQEQNKNKPEWIFLDGQFALVGGRRRHVDLVGPARSRACYL